MTMKNISDEERNMVENEKIETYNRCSCRFVSTWFDQELALPSTTGFHHNYIVPRTVHIYIYTYAFLCSWIDSPQNGWRFWCNWCKLYAINYENLRHSKMTMMKKKKVVRKKKSEDEVNRPSLMWHEECRTNSSSKLDNRETLTKHEYLS